MITDEQTGSTWYDVEDIYSLEHSQYSEDRKHFPFHIGPLSDAIKHNLQDYRYNNRGQNKWQIIFVGSIQDCYRAMNTLIERRTKTQPPAAVDGGE